MKINELTNQCIVVLSSVGVQCRSIPLKTIKARFKSQILHSVLVLHNNNKMACNLDSRLEDLEEQGKTMVDATRRLLETVNTFCQTCSTQTGLREFIFEGIDTLPQFCNWILGDENKGVICIAHNFGGYDGQFILHYILEYGTVKPEVIMNGNTILRMKVGRVTFLDSYQFLHMRLANFPDTFGLTEMKKGYFPHLANTLANQKYVEPYFPVDMYNPGQMSVKDREVF